MVFEGKVSTQTNDFNKPNPEVEGFSGVSEVLKDSKVSTPGLLNGDTALKMIFPELFFAHSVKVYDELISRLIAEEFRG